MSDCDFRMDLVICLDTTGAMGASVDALKRDIGSLHQMLLQRMAHRGAALSGLRVRVIAFKDYRYDADPMIESRFCSLPEEGAALEAFLGGLECGGGGDLPENALEALALAIGSDWEAEGLRRRQVVLMLSDGAAHPLGECADAPAYPGGLPKTAEELRELWENGAPSSAGTFRPRMARLVAFVPPEEPWIGMTEWRGASLCFESAPGLSGVSLSSIADAIIGAL